MTTTKQHLTSTPEEDPLVKYAAEFAQAAELRPMTATEIKTFVYTWLHYTSKEDMTKQEALDWIENKIKSCNCWVADCQGVLLSFLVTQRDTIVFAYTLKPYKKQGLCRRLIEFATGRYLPVHARLRPKKRQIAKTFTFSQELQLWVKNR